VSLSYIAYADKRKMVIVCHCLNKDESKWNYHGSESSNQRSKKWPRFAETFYWKIMEIEGFFEFIFWKFIGGTRKD